MKRDAVLPAKLRPRDALCLAVRPCRANPAEQLTCEVDKIWGQAVQPRVPPKLLATDRRQILSEHIRDSANAKFVIEYSKLMLRTT